MDQSVYVYMLKVRIELSHIFVMILAQFNFTAKGAGSKQFWKSSTKYFWCKRKKCPHWVWILCLCDIKYIFLLMVLVVFLFHEILNSYRIYSTVFLYFSSVHLAMFDNDNIHSFLNGEIVAIENLKMVCKYFIDEIIIIKIIFMYQ